jgi:hypothetical protein
MGHHRRGSVVANAAKPQRQAPAASPLFQVRDAAELVGTNRRRLEGWVEQDFIKPRAPGKGKGSRHGFSVGNLVEGVLLMAVQAVIGEHSPHPSVLMDFAREHAETLGARLLEGWAPVNDPLVILHTPSGPVAFFRREMLHEEGNAQVERLLKDNPAVTYVDVERPLIALAQRLRGRP